MLVLVAGCSTSGGTVTIFPTGHFLLQSTKDVVNATPTPVPTPRELDKSILADYYVEPGDILLVEPLSLDAPFRFPSDQTVLADGTIDLGGFGRIIVAGHTVEQIEEVINQTVKAAEPDAGPINVRLISPQGALYYVLGEVNTPGSFPLIGRETVLDGILAAGGLSSRASTCNIIVSRPTHPGSCRVVLPVCYRQIVQLGDATTNYQLMPGDRIYVATRTIWEELNPCQNKAGCSRCNSGLQCPCPDPGVAEYAPPIKMLPFGLVKKATPEASLLPVPVPMVDETP